MQQLAGLTYHMINTGVFDPGYTFGQICDSVELTAKVVLGQSNPALTSVHRSALAPYFSPTTGSSLGAVLRMLASALLECPADDDRAKKCVANLHEWAERSIPMAKNIMLLAIERRSPFVFDILHWIKDITEVLLAAATAPACRVHYKLALVEQAERWALLLSWIPDETESLDCAASWSATSVMFDVAGAARKWNSEQVYEAAQRTLLRWAMRPARRENAWHDVEQAMLALTAIAIKSPFDPDGAALKVQLTKALQAEQIPAAALLRGVGAGLRRAAVDYDQQMLRTQGWDEILASLEVEKRNEILSGLAQILEGAAAE